jgi:hypothetical protein
MNRFQDLRENYIDETTGKPISRDKLQQIFRDEYGCVDMKGTHLKKIELNSLKRPIPQEELKAYCLFFNTTADYLLGFTNDRTKNGRNKNVYDFMGLDYRTTDALKRLNSDEKLILDKMVQYGFLYCLRDVKRLIGYNALQPEIEITLKKEKRADNDEYALEMLDFLGDNDVSHFFDVAVTDTIKSVIDGISQDEELLKHFHNVNASSAVKKRKVYASDLPKLSKKSNE